MANITIDFLADISGATKEISKLGSSVDKQISQITSAFSGLTRVFAGLAATIGVGLSFKAAIDSAAQYEDSVNELATALKLTGIESRNAVTGLEDFASEIQATTRFSDDAVLRTSALIQNLARLSEDGLKQATNAAINLSAALRIDLNSAATLIGKAAEGNIGAFSRYGIVIQKGASNAETFANTLKTLNDRFGGAAVAQTNSYAGAIDQLRNNFDDLLKQVGFGIIQNKDFITSLKSLSSSFVALVPLAIEFGKAISGSISFTINGTKNAVKFIQNLIANIDDFFARLREFEILNRVFTGIEKGIGGVIGAVKTLSSNLFETLGLLGKVQSSQASVNDLRSEQSAARQQQFAARTPDSSSLFGPGIRIDTALQEKLAKDRSKALLDEQAERDKIIKDQLKAEADLRRQIFSNLQTFIGNIGQGAQGVANSLASVATTFGDTIIPGLGGAAGQLIQFLAQGPEAVRAQIQAFIDNIPLIIDNIVQSIPVVIDTLAANSGKIISSLSSQMPVVATRLATGLISEAPNIAKSFITSLVSESGRLIQSIVDGIKNAFGSLFGGGGGVGGLLGGVTRSIGKVFRFAEGGIVPGGAPFTDRVPALLSPGEVVLNREQQKELARERVQGGEIGAGSGQPLTINLQVGEEQLAQVLVNLTRQGFRLSGV